MWWLQHQVGVHAGHAVIVTDGNCCSVDPTIAPCCLEEDLIAIADEMRAAGITVIAVGIGDPINNALLRAFADNLGTVGDYDPYVVLAELYNGPDNIEHKLLEWICD